MSRALLRSALELRAAGSRPSPKLLRQLPVLSRSFNSTPPIVEPIPQTHVKNAANPTAGEPRPLAFKKSHPTAPPKPIDDSVKTLLPFLVAQPGHYITVHIHGFPYLVQEGDKVRLPFRMPGVMPGDVLRLNRASVIGSRDYTLKGAPHIDERLFECRATVLGTESEPLRIKIKTKRRQRKEKQAKSKHRYTILRISELNLKQVEDIQEPSA
ncbi:putative aconitate hydratase [Stachybotrys elegans]|uniref:Large ribosomal subunit protein bL21m n=1 Tax=Stachybotrys elegans TaxID=80388 RepID=A0A8K0SWT7_9HYPO|nr:putative aconitate hydratase [Stachybotrys elegans]